MKEKIKRISACIMAIIMLLSIVPAAGALAADVVASGTCGADGDNLTWVLDSEGTLTVSGNGKMANYSLNGQPWYSEKNSIKSVVIESGVTSIGDSAFDGCGSLTSITLGNSVTSVGYGVFAHCTSLAGVTIPDSLTSIGDSAFCDCSSLASVTLGNSVTNNTADVGN